MHLMGLVNRRHRIGRRGEFRPVVTPRPRGKRGCERHLPAQRYLVFLVYVLISRVKLIVGR